MNFFNRISDFLKSVWHQTNTAAKIGLGLATAVCIAVIAGVGYWSSQPYYVPLTEMIGATKAAEVKEVLDANKIPNQLSYAGNSVLVDQSQYGVAKSLIEELIAKDEFADNQSPLWGGTGKPDHASNTRQLQSRLAATITKLKPVRSAEVTLAMPEPSAFIRNQSPPSASVIVNLQESVSFNRALGSAVATIVASGVEGLHLERIKVIDGDSGRVLAAGGDNLGMLLGEQEEQRRSLESALENKVLQQLEALLGFGMASVSVTAEMDFDRRDVEKILVVPDQQVKTSETVSTREVKREPAASGAAGLAANLTGNSGNSSQDIEKSEDITAEFENGREIHNESRAPGKLLRLSVSVVAELPSPDPEAAADATASAAPPDDPNQQPLSKAEMESYLEEIIKTAVGFDAQRGDQFELLVTKLANKETWAGMLVPESTTLSPLLQDVLRNVSLAIASLVALIIGFLLIKRLQPVTIKQEDNQLSPERLRQITDMSLLVKQNPELLSRIVAAWANSASPESGSEDPDSQNSARRRAA